MRRSTFIRCAKLANALSVAAPLHKGFDVYASRQDAVTVLRAMQSADLKWWDSSCSAFIERVEGLPARTHASGASAANCIIVVEGLDGVGKTTTTTGLAKKLSGELVRTPNPELEPLRAKFRALPPPLARAFYCAANYLGAEEILKAAGKHPVVVDRWWGSTCSMALANPDLIKNIQQLPAERSEVYRWPSDLPAFDLGVLLTVSEEIRLKRMAKRGDENAEEAVLAAKKDMRAIAVEAHRRMEGLYTEVDTPTWMTAVNTTIKLLEGRKDHMSTEKWNAVKGKLVAFTAAELSTVRPY